ncbi:MAG: sigma-70 family RNA polymerase sigma factor [Clostridia bacterium]|nr:sigma-70 family RNA polymerase sigma factor [Clostridia bacterium]
MYENNNTLLEEAASGNSEKMEILINQNLGLIWGIVKKFIGKGYETEDLYQIACMGFIKAVKRFDKTYKVKLSTYAVPYILGEIKKFIRDDGIIKISRSVKELGFKVLMESINDGNSERKIFSEFDEQSKIVDKITIEELVENLNMRDRKIIKLRFYGEKTQMQVAKILGISQVQVSRIEKRILKDMKEKLKAEV